MFHARLKIVAFVIFAGMVLVLARLVQMQLLKADFYREEGRRRRIRVRSLDAPRGAIITRDGVILAEDLPVRSVCVVLAKLDHMDKDNLDHWRAWVADIAGDTLEGVSARLAAARERIASDIRKRKKFILSHGPPGSAALEKKAKNEERFMRRKLPRTPQVLYEDVAFDVAARAEAASTELDGLVVTESMKRKYPRGSLAAHVVGYTAKVTPGEYDLYRFNYLGDESKRFFLRDTIGRTGIEKQYDFELRGRRGRIEEVINVNEQPQKILSNEPSKPGRDIVLTIDSRLQETAQQALAEVFARTKHPGAAVCIDVHTGDVLAMASCPSYDPNTLSRDISELIDPDGLGKYRPMYNRAIRGGYPLGSVFKIVTATAALETGAITPSTKFTCDGYLKVGKRKFYCWIGRAPYFGGHGTIDLLDAIKVSCNVYFYNVGRLVGPEALVEWAKRYGFGRVTGIDLPLESPGNVETPHRGGDVINLAIGQGRLLVTPLQVCRMIAAVAGEGGLAVPRVRLNARGQPAGLVGFKTSTWQTLRKGLYDVVNVKGGTGYRTVRSDLVTIAGKTGTAQAGRGGDHAWFAGFAPYENPQIAFAVVIEHGGHGGAAAGPVAKALAEAWAKRRERR